MSERTETRELVIRAEVAVCTCDGCGSAWTPGLPEIMSFYRAGSGGAYVASPDQDAPGWTVALLPGRRIDLCPRCLARAVLAARGKGPPVEVKAGVAAASVSVDEQAKSPGSGEEKVKAEPAVVPVGGAEGMVADANAVLDGVHNMLDGLEARGRDGRREVIDVEVVEKPLKGGGKRRGKGVEVVE